MSSSFSLKKKLKLGLASGLISLEVDNNSLQGLLPSEVGMLSSLQQLILGNTNDYGNAFNGEIPSEIGLLSMLSTTVGLEHNAFTGTIPSQLGSMTCLSGGFKISDNNLQGSIPVPLYSLSHILLFMFYWFIYLCIYILFSGIEWNGPNVATRTILR